MSKDELSIRIAGQNGDGIFSSGDTLAKVCSRSSLDVHGSRLYQSVIRGGHVSYSVRAANREVRAPADYIDLLIALRKDSFEVDGAMLREGSVVLYDAQGSRIREDATADLVARGVKMVNIPAMALARDIDPSLKVLRNTVFVGAAIAMYKLDIQIMKDMLQDTFGHKGDAVVGINVSAAQAGFDWVNENSTPIEHTMQYAKKSDNPVIGGNESLALGMLNGGLQSYSWYPMTPASPVGNFLSKYGPLHGCVVKQMEDEINVANFAVGAGYAGSRSACATSGGGFALMTEAVGFAAMIEAPVVMIEVARGGPSTGLPTKTEQGDLNQLYGASQGDYPRAIIAQSTIEDGFYLGQEALNIAEKYQLPVLLSSDLYLGEHFETVPHFDYDRIPIERGKIITDKVPEGEEYLRFKLTEDGISPRAIPGVKGGRHDAGSDEHDENGKLVSDWRAGYPDAIQVRLDQMEKRMKKMDVLLEELPAPVADGHAVGDCDLLIVSWGSTLDTIKEARTALEKDGVKTAQLHIKYILPFHSKEVTDILTSYEAAGTKIVMIEANFTGQMQRHIRAETSFDIKDHYRRYDGEYILPREVVVAMKEKLN
ncbi:MAG: 2-oxoacid:acceptor oxidoreductase subunit alpha [Candidatus Kariarchaeaceae archaeon]|jgi:2-oxoglutarate ferredoxin oxidoreductase subunit alpha